MDEAAELAALQRSFQVTELGAGDPVAGSNLLATMACVLADLAPSDGTVLTHDGRPARLGTSLLLSGALSTALVTDEIITEVGRRQSNLAACLRRYLDHIDEQKQKPGATLPPMGPQPSAVEDLLAATQGELDPLYGTREQLWVRLLSQAPVEHVTDLARRPKILVSATRPNNLKNQLQDLRPGRPLVHLGIGKPRDLAELADLGTALIEGRCPVGDGCKLVRANILLTDPMGMIDEAAKDPDERTSWLGHFLWLSDGDAGPEVPELIAAQGRPERTAERFRRALSSLIARRLNMPETEPITLALDTRIAAFRWTEFLRDMEPRLPGVSGAARSLPDSLVFGLGQMARIKKRLTFSMAGVEAFARFLVRRMANARTALLHAVAAAQRRSQIERIVRKLEKGCFTTRTIYRDLCLSAADCDECLRWLLAANLVIRLSGAKWQLAKGARLDFRNCSVPLLEV